MRETRPSGSVEGVTSNRDPYSDLKTIFFFAKPATVCPGVQRRGPVKGAACPRSSQTLDGEHRWKTPSSKGAGEVEKKMGEEKRIRPRTPKGKVEQEQ
jgi:hypothetical protein